MSERIKAAAVKTTSGKIYEGKAHFAAHVSARRDGECIACDEDYGFVTTAGRFVSREDAEIIGMRERQIRSGQQDPYMVHAADFYL